MKTPDEIKKYVQTWREVLVDDCVDFPYAVHTMFHTAAGLVESLLAENEQLERERDQFKRERDVLLKVLKGDCGICAHWQECVDNDFALDRNYNDCWEWRGVQEVE